MIRLIKAELTKLFHKKSFLIVTLIFMAFCVLTNIIYKNSDDMIISEEESVGDLEKENTTLDLTNPDDLSIYINNLTNIECLKLKEKYSTATSLIDTYIYPTLYEAYESKYLLNDENTYEIYLQQVNDYKAKLSSSDWQYFTNLQIDKLNSQLKSAEGTSAISTYEALLKVANYRLENQIAYDNSNFLNNAIESLEQNLPDYYTLSNKGKLTEEEKEYYNTLKESVLKNEYILKNKVDIQNSSTLQSVLHNFSLEFGLFILIYIIMIAGSIVSEEFNKGTIKYLLTKPYKRTTILASKLLTLLILIPLIIIMMLLVELLIGGLILGFSSLNVPVVIMDFANDALVIRNIFLDVFLNIISVLPSYLILGVLCFALSTLTASTSAAITITFLFYLISNVIANIALVYNFKLFKWFISLHWDFSYLVNFEENVYQIKPLTSLIVIGLYLIVILCITFAYFNKKDVKNI